MEDLTLLSVCDGMARVYPDDDLMGITTPESRMSLNIYNEPEDVTPSSLPIAAALGKIFPRRMT